MVIDMRRAKKKVAIAICFIAIAFMVYIAQRTIATHTEIGTGEIKYKEYTSMNGTFLYKLPEGWKSQDQLGQGSDIVFRSNFESKDKSVYGSVELWSLNANFSRYMNEISKSTEGVTFYKSYTVEQLKVNERPGYLIQYIRRDENNKYVKGFEVYKLDKNNMCQRFVYNMDEKSWKDEYRMLLLEIAANGMLK